MTESTDMLFAEIANGLPLPDKQGVGYGFYETLLNEIIRLRNDTSMPEYERLHKLHGLDTYVHSFVARPVYHPQTPRPLLRWYPGGSSSEGFLGWGESLEEVLAEDAKVLRALGYTANKVGMRLKGVLDGISSTAGFDVQKESWRGCQECPFDPCRTTTWMLPHSSIDFTIVNTRTGEGIMGPGLIWHLIAEHGFFEGKRSPYRVDPTQLVKVLFG